MPTLLLFSASILTSSCLLFLIQPMFAKMLLPVLGGAPQVWNACMVFFQAVLLLGYAYAHGASRRISLNQLIIIHLVVMTLPLFFLPFSAVDLGRPPLDADPSLWTLMILAGTVGLPFFAVSTMGPLLQKWFSHTHHEHAHDPYFLNAVGSSGSIIALLGYPLIVEPLLPLSAQSTFWMGGYLFLLVLTMGCLWISLRSKSASPQQDNRHTPSIAGMRRMRWIFLGFAPSSLMLGVTSFLTADIAAAPLLWVVPLVLYLLSFVMVFARKPIFSHVWIMKALPVCVVVLLGLMAFRLHHPLFLIMGLHLTIFFILSLACHGELAQDRPPVDHLTEFYLLVAVGGVLGGIFNALISPLIFDSLLEYPLVAALAGLIYGKRKTQDPEKKALIWDWGLGLLSIVYILTTGGIWLKMEGTGSLIYGMLAITGPLVAACLFFMGRPVRYALGLTALLIAGVVTSEKEFGASLFTQRGFYGVHRVAYNAGEQANILFHGSTAHGMQKRDPASGRRPSGYYHYTGPVGQVFELFGQNLNQIGIVGLGTGGLAGYARTGHQMTFFELDPLVAAIAEDPRYFSFLSDARAAGAEVTIQMGDARRSLEDWKEPFDLLLLDAFNSDAIPLHLMTREAAALYLERVGDKGLVMFHISNHYLSFSGVLADFAADLNATALHQFNGINSMRERRESKFPSEWVVMSRNPEIIDALRNASSAWRELEGQPGARIRTDDFSNLFQVLR